MNTVTIQLRSFQDFDSTGNKKGKEMFGFSVFDDFEEKVYLDFNYENFLQYINEPQQLLDLVLDFWSDDFKGTIKCEKGFYINDDWHDVDSKFRIKKAFKALA